MKLRPALFSIFFVSVILTFAVYLVSCKTAQRKENKPAAVATRFLKHLRAFEFEEARKLGTESTGKMLDMFSLMMELSKKNGKDPGLEKKDMEIDVVKTAIDGKIAVVTYKNEEGTDTVSR